MRRLCWIVVAVLLVTMVAWADEAHDHSASVTDPRFEFLKGLEGRWTGQTGMEEGGKNGAFEFRVTSGGTAIEEREFVGTAHEMMTVYHMVGSDLVATHYCTLGNQPRLVAAKKVVDGALTFSCDGKPGNSKSHADEHVHAWTIALGADGKLHYTAKLLKGGEVTHAPDFLLTRERLAASR